MTDPAKLTESLCPVCLSAVPATLVTKGDAVTLEGRCPDHGSWQTQVWSGPPSMETWCGDGCALDTGADRVDTTAAELATCHPCPGSCGLCARHQQHTCTALLEVTRRCDLVCPVCFAESSADVVQGDLALEELTDMLEGLFAAQGPVNLQLSGGEPTMRDDLLDIIAAARTAGFTFVQLNTNGLRIASDPAYAIELRNAGLASVFLQFDGVSDDTYRSLRGRPLATQKLRAVERCADARLGVVLVPTVVPGINDQEIGSLVRFAAQWAGVVRGVHFQPVSYLGRYPDGNRSRLTLPDMLRALEQQTSGEIHASDFAPSCCEHKRCSFRARYWVRDGAKLELVRSGSTCCPSGTDDAAKRATAATSRQWSRRDSNDSQEESRSRDGLDRFLDEVDRIVCVSGMLFQDAWSIDLERVRRCCVHVVVRDRGLVPFCLWNLTSESGQRLYSRR